MRFEGISPLNSFATLLCKVIRLHLLKYIHNFRPQATIGILVRLTLILTYWLHSSSTPLPHGLSYSTSTLADHIIDIMATTHPYYQLPQPSYPIQMPQKPGGYCYPQQHSFGRVSASPPEGPESVTTSGVASYEPSATSSNYAGSASDYESTSGAASVDLLDYMGNRLNGSFDPLPLDRSLAKQAQTSGELNAKHRELLELQALAQRRLAGARANFANGMKAAKDVQKDLQWTQKRVDALNDRAARKYPEQYQTAQRRYPAPVDY